METEELTYYLEKITDQISDFLIPHGFKRYNNTFNRWTEDGLCQVFNLQMGIKSLEGQFTTNLGVFIPEVYRSMEDKELPGCINVGCCTINARFCDFTDTDDEWWEITPYFAPIVQELIDLLQTYGLPLFIKFSDRESIINQLVSFDEKYHVSINPKLDIALILENMGKHGEAIKIFNHHYRDSIGHKPHIEHLEKLANKYSWPIHDN